MTQIGTATGTGGTPILTTVTSLFLSDGFWCGLDAGFFPWDYLPYYAGDYYPYDYSIADVPQYDNDNTGAIDNGYRWLTPRFKPCRRSSITRGRSGFFIVGRKLRACKQTAFSWNSHHCGSLCLFLLSLLSSHLMLALLFS